MEQALIPSQAVEANGNGPEIDLGGDVGKKFLVTLHITRHTEQSALDVGIFGSEDKTNWGAKAIAAFPQKFYAGESQILLDLTGQPGIKYLRGGWTMNRWGRGPSAGRFTFSVEIRQLSAEAAA